MVGLRFGGGGSELVVGPPFTLCMDGIVFKHDGCALTFRDRIVHSSSA